MLAQLQQGERRALGGAAGHETSTQSETRKVKHHGPGEHGGRIKEATTCASIRSHGRSSRPQVLSKPPALPCEHPPEIYG